MAETHRPLETCAVSLEVAGEPRPSRGQRALWVFGPIGLTLALYGLLWIVAPGRIATQVGMAATASLFALGTAVVLGPAALGDHVSALSTWDLALVVGYLTVASAFFFSYNLDLFQRIPRIGPVLRRARLNAVKTLKERRWIRRWATVGVAVFVLLPLPGSGSLGGSIVGRLLGLSRPSCFVTVSVAGLVVTLLYACFGAGVASWANSHEIGIPVRLASLVVLAVFAYLLSRWISRLAKST